MSKRRQTRPRGSKPKGPTGPQGEPPAAINKGEDAGGGWRIGDNVGPPDWVTSGKSKPKAKPPARTQVKSGPLNRVTTVEGQPMYQNVTFPTAEPSFKGGARRTAWLDKKNKILIIPNVDRDRLPGGKGGPLYYKISAVDLGDIIAEKRGSGNQSISASDVSMFLRSESRKNSGSRVEPFDISDDLTGFEVNNRLAGFENVSSTKLYRGNAPDETVFEAPETVEPDIVLELIGEPFQTIPENNQKQQKPSNAPPGTYYFDKGRFLRRGKYNG